MELGYRLNLFVEDEVIMKLKLSKKQTGHSIQSAFSPMAHLVMFGSFSMGHAARISPTVRKTGITS